jgi:hypothetical protein
MRPRRIVPHPGLTRNMAACVRGLIRRSPKASDCNAAAAFPYDTRGLRLRFVSAFCYRKLIDVSLSGKPMSRSIVGKFLAVALAIAPAFYCAQSGAQAAAIQHGFEKAAQEAAPKIKKGLREVWDTVLGVGVDKALHAAVDAVVCAKENKGEDCKNASK